jgi:N-methylhydantoinase A
VLESRSVHFGEAEGWTETTVYDRDRLLAGAAFDGPAIVQEVDSTTVVPPGAKVEVDEFRNLLVDVRGVARV